MHPNPTLEPHLECYGDGYALLRPEPTTAEPRARNYVMPSRYVLTDLGRRALAMARLFDQGPTVTEVIAS